MSWVQPRGCSSEQRRPLLSACSCNGMHGSLLSGSSTGVRALGIPTTCTQAHSPTTRDARENCDPFFSGQALQSHWLACSLGGGALASRHPCQFRPHTLDLLCTYASPGAHHPHPLLATLSSFINLHYVWSWRLDCTCVAFVAVYLGCLVAVLGVLAEIAVLALLSLCAPAQMLADARSSRGPFIDVELALSEGRGWTGSTRRWVSQPQCERRTAAFMV
jgi:hypothetical protein